MAPFGLILLAFALLHLPGLRRWPGGPRPADRAGGALGLVLVFTGTLHFTRAEPFVQMVPPALPWPEALVAISGVAEIAIGLGLLVPRLRRASGWAAFALFLAVWPANVWVAWSGDYPEGLSQSPLHHALRVPFQLLYLGWAAWCGLGHLPGEGIRRWGFARLYDRAQARYELHAGERRRALLSGLRGTVLEIGPGTGVNLDHLPAGARWIGVEPNPHMHAALRERARAAGVQAEVRGISAQGLDVPDESVDAVVSTLVLCSVPDPDAVLRDVCRVLRPGGRFVFMEHVAAPRGSGLRRVQHVMRPFWRFFADGCCPDRELGEAIRRAGFSSLDLEEYSLPPEAAPAFVRPHVAGVALR